MITAHYYFWIIKMMVSIYLERSLVRGVMCVQFKFTEGLIKKQWNCWVNFSLLKKPNSKMSKINSRSIYKFFSATFGEAYGTFFQDPFSHH